ncbi:MAG: MaoC/PaaZ C-terminal domain-containing protein [Patescibacteria group bacterium]
MIGPYWEKCFEIGDEDGIRKFAESIGDNNPLHHDDEAAKRAGLLGIIEPGVRTVGRVSSTIADRIPGVMVRKLEMEFLNPLYAGSFLSVLCTVKWQRRRLASVIVTLRSGFDVVAKGTCLLVLP